MTSTCLLLFLGALVVLAGLGFLPCLPFGAAQVGTVVAESATATSVFGVTAVAGLVPESAARCNAGRGWGLVMWNLRVVVSALR